MIPRRFLANPMTRRWYTPFGSHVSDNDPTVLGREKENLLKGKVIPILKSAPGWNEKLASDSEAMVKAEREPDPPSLEDLQLESIKFLSLDGKIEIEKEIKVQEEVKEKITIKKT